MVFKRVAGSKTSCSGDAPNEAYVLLTSQRGLSRRCRAAWFLQRLGEELEEGLGDRDWQLLVVTGDSNVVTPETLVLFLVCNYSFVFVVDMSPSMAAVSNTTNEVNFDQAYAALRECLQSLCQPFALTEGGRIIVPNLYISVLAHTDRAKPVEVLVQGAHVNHTNVEDLLKQLLMQLHHLENDIATTGTADNGTGGASQSGDTEKKLGDTSLEGMLKAGNLAVHLLPYSSIKGVILVTDGVCGFVGAGVMNTLVGQMRRSNVSCWALLVGGSPSPMCCYGLVPDVDTLSFICTACNGCVMIYGVQDKGSPDHCVGGSSSSSNGANPYQRSILMWSFQLTGPHTYHSSDDKQVDMFQAVACPEGHQHHHTTTMASPFLSVVGSRLREGYCIDTVSITDDQIIVLLKQPWQPGVTMEYSVTTTWPLDFSHNRVTVSIGYKGPYTFLHEVKRELSHSNLPVYRSLAVKRFKQSLHSLLTADQLLVHSWMFSTHSFCTAIPHSAREGMPLFYMSPNENVPVLSEGMTFEKSKKSKEGQFVSYWRQICSLDVKHWQKWLHLERISVVLHSDCQLPKHLLIPNPSTARYSPFQCRVAAAQLFSYLKTWSSVVLLENLCYIRFLPMSGEPHPQESSKFCIIRVGQKPHRMLLNIGFLEGTNNQWREQVMTSLEEGLAALVLSGGTVDNVASGKRKKITTLLPPKAHVISMTVFKKPLQRLLISHETPVTDGDKTMTQGNSTPVQNYLIHYKWVWHFPVPILFSKVSLALLRQRLHEGFHITSTHNGYVSLCVQLSMKQSDSELGGVALVQYVILPEATSTTSSVSYELWVEPQKGQVVSPPEGLLYLLGASHDQISSHMYAVDRNVVGRIVTNQMLWRASLTSDQVLPKLPSTQEVVTPGQRDVDVLFDLSSLLPQSRCLVMMVSGFCNNKSAENGMCVSPINAQFYDLMLDKLLAVCHFQLSVHCGGFLLDRLSQSIELESFFAICKVDNQCKQLREDEKWKCFVRKMDRLLHLVFVPSLFISIPSSKSVVAKILPIVVIECSNSLLMCPDPMQQSPPTLQPDMYQQVLFPPAQDTLVEISLPHSPGALFGSSGQQLSMMCSQIRSIHSQCFLDAMYTALKGGIDNIVPSDFIVVTELCERRTSSLDITPFIATLCTHSTIANVHQLSPKGETAMNDDMESPSQRSVLDYGRMIELLKSQEASSIALCLANVESGSFLSPAHQPCVGWGSELQQQLQKVLLQAHYYAVPGTNGYYFFSIIAPQSSNNEKDKQVNFVIGDEDVSCHSDESDTMLPQTMFDEDRALSETHPPLFLGITCYVNNAVTQDEIEGATMDTVSTCLKALLDKTDGITETNAYTITMEITSFITPTPQPLPTPMARLRVQSGLSPMEGKSFSIDPPYSGNELTTEFPSTDEVFENSGSGDLIADLPPVQRKSIGLVQEWILWLFEDEMISLACENDYMTQSFILAIDNHLSGGYMNFPHSCSLKEIPLKFVFGSDRCFSRFITEFESLTVDGYQLKQCSDWYYLVPHPPDHLLKKQITLSQEDINFDDPVRRESFPTQHHVFHKSHRRAISCTAVVPPHQNHVIMSGHNQISQPVSPSRDSQPHPPISHYSSLGSLLSKGEGLSGYDASHSNSATSLSAASGTLDVRRCCSAEGGSERFWLLIQVSEELVKVLFHTRSSRVLDKDAQDKMSDLFDNVATIIGDKCCKVNQFYLLQDMMDTRLCSPLILPDSAPGAWVDENFSSNADMASQLEQSDFRASQFACQPQWCHQIPLQWRLKESLKVSTAQHIARAALDAFQLINRENVFVVQEIDPEMQESIYYLSVHESLCSMEEGERPLVRGADTVSRTNPSDTATRDMMLTTEDSLESDLAPPSSSEVQKDEMFSSNQGQLRESLKLELHGISTPSEKLKEHLVGLISRKLDDKVLEIMCSYHARNRTLKLVPEDVQFLQPSGAPPTFTLYFSIPELLHDYTQPLALYYLQNVSSFCLKPKYTSDHIQNYFQLPSSIMQMIDNVSVDLLYDHTSLYLRPHTKGRGMAVLSTILLDSSGQYEPFSPGVTMPTIVTDWSSDSYKYLMNQVTSSLERMSTPSLCVYIWEKGNIGFTELRYLLTNCFYHSVIDCLLELFLLPSPVATVLEGEESEYETDDTLLLEDAFEETPTIATPPGMATTPVQRQDSCPTRSRHDTFSIIQAVQDAVGTPPDYNVAVEGQIAGLQDMRHKDKETRVPPSELSWQQKERGRRIREERLMRHKQASYGELGQLTPTFDQYLLPVLSHASELGSPALTHCKLQLSAHYMVNDFLNELLLLLTKWAQLQVNVFCRQSEGRAALHYMAATKPVKSRFLRLNSISSSTSSICSPTQSVSSNYILIGRNVQQWEESCDPSNKEIHRSLPWLDSQSKRFLQMFQPLDSVKVVNTPKYIPMMHCAAQKPTFVPRQRLVYMTIQGLEANLYLYNISDDLVLIFKKNVNKMLSWQQKRAGLMNHIVSQKMGLYYHASAGDIAPNATEASEYCRTIQDVGLLAKCSTSPSKDVELLRLENLKHHPVDQTVLERFYFNQLPLKLVDNPGAGDKVYRHGNQFKESWIHVHRQAENIQLLSKVFATWQQKKMDEAPVASNKVASLKRMSRLLHYCTTPLLVDCLKPHPLVTTTTNEEVVIVNTASSESGWQDSLCSEFLNKYCEYLKSLNFLQINESSPQAVSPKRAHRGKSYEVTAASVKPQKVSELYQCFQRSWPGGIMMVDLTFLQKKTFCVKLFSLESTRLDEGLFHSVSPKVSERFSTECAKLKDFTHIHSFSYDFHLQYLRGLLINTSHAVDVLLFLETFTKQFARPPQYVRNRIAKDQLSVLLINNTNPLELYKHILANSAEFSMTTIEGRPNLSASQLPPHHLCLLLDISPENLGTATEVCFTNLLQVTQHQYEVMLLLAYKEDGEEQQQQQQKNCLDLILYLVLLNKYEEFPRLSHFQLTSPIPSPSPSPDLPIGDDEGLHISVQKKRRSLGYESLYSPTSAAQVVINDHMIAEQVDSLKSHLEHLVRKASHHMTRERLWKRLLYGKQLASTSDRNKKFGMEKLTCSEFCSLLTLVKLCPLDTLDSRLAVFKKMNRSWYSMLISLLQTKFDFNFRGFSSEDGKREYAAIINPNWQDMFILVQSGTSEYSHSHGLSAVYRKSREGGELPAQKRDITAHIEDDQEHNENVINFVCSYLWSRMILDAK